MPKPRSAAAVAQPWSYNARLRHCVEKQSCHLFAAAAGPQLSPHPEIGLLSSIQPTRLHASLGWVASCCIRRLPGPSPLVTGRSTAAHSPGIASYIHITSLQLLQLAVM